MTKAQVVTRVLQLGPVPILTKSEADLCDRAIMSSILGAARDHWRKNNGPGVPSFEALPPGWQTV